MNDQKDHHSGNEIAIIGMVGRFPGAQDLDQFWQNLRSGVESIHFYTDEELLGLGASLEIISDTKYIKAGGILEGVDMFDAPFFGFTPREAEITDPQHRLFLTCAWEALEHAGYDAEQYSGSIGVYAGVAKSAYIFNLYSQRGLIRNVGVFQAMIGNDKDHAPTRVSYKLNLRGPSVNVQTACSTSLVAVHIACQSLLYGECDMALAGGCAISGPYQGVYYREEDSIESPDGHCRAFDAKAQGTVGGSGLGVVVLKRLQDAIADGDTIHALIKGSAVNNDGALKVGYTAPSVEGQSQVIAEALAVAQVEPDTITYVETHGTGTTLGDPIEIAALTKAFKQGTERRNFCAIGSVKTNIGHLDAAAGIASLIKVVLMLKQREIPPSLHFEQPNPQIDFAGSPFYVNTSLRDWPQESGPRRAGVSSFGIGGTNAHVIVEESAIRQASGPSRTGQLILLSAKTANALESVTDNLLKYFTQQPPTDLADIAFTLQAGRRAFKYRRMFVCSDLEDAVNVLKSRDAARLHTTAQELKDRPIAFMFPGQGAQYARMGGELYRGEEMFRHQVDMCAEIARQSLNIDIRELLYPDREREMEANDQLRETQFAQPSLFITEYALAMQLMEWGVRPQAMIGHSVGEYVCACLAGVLSLEDAMRLVTLRGRIVQEATPGAMLSVTLSGEDLRAMLDEDLSLAAVNAPERYVISGQATAISRFQERLTERNITSTLLRTSHAFHSHLMDPILEAFTTQVRKIKTNPPSIPYISNVTGTWMAPADALDPEYWARHLRQTVQFAAGVQELLKDSDRILLEVGPGRALSTLAKQQFGKAGDTVALSSLPHPRDQQTDSAFVLNTIGRLWLAGTAIDWSRFHASEGRLRAPLPTYPFELRSYWVSMGGKDRNAGATQTGPLMEAFPSDQEVGASFSLYSRPNLSNTYIAPRNDIEQSIAAILQEILGIELVGVHDDFFELGGDSLRAIQLITRLRDAYGIAPPVRMLFESPTTARLAIAFEELLIDHIEAMPEATAQRLISDLSRKG